MSGVTDPEGFKMLVRGSLPGILENCAPDQLEATAETAVKALGKAWRIVEAACPDHTYEKAHARGGGGGGFRGGGGGKFPPKQPTDIVPFGKFQDGKATWIDLAKDRRPQSRSYVEWMSTSEKTKPEDQAFFKKLLSEHYPEPAGRDNGGEGPEATEWPSSEDTPF